MSGALQHPKSLPRLWAHEAMGAGLRRVLLRCLKIAAAAVPADVHRARLALKRARAVLRLAEACGVRWAADARRELAAHARRLAATRDRAVVAGLARAWAVELRGETRRCALAMADEAAAARSVRRPAWSHWLHVAHDRFARLPWPAFTRRTLRRALAKSVHRARRRAHSAGDTPEADPLHEWRKAVIVLREQLYVLHPILTRSQAGLPVQLHGVARKLGAAADCFMLGLAAGDPLRRAGLAIGARRLQVRAQQARLNAIADGRGEWKALRPALQRKLV